MIVLGHEFNKPDQNDWDGFAGMTESSLICHTDHATIIYDPDTRIVTEICGDPARDGWQERTWKMELVF